MAEALARRLAAPALTVALALGAAGCGSSTEGTGRELFAARCGSCHTLKEAGTSGRIGPNFDQVRLTRPVILSTIKHGAPPMPANLVTGRDAQRIADFLVSASGSAARY